MTTGLPEYEFLDVSMITLPDFNKTPILTILISLDNLLQNHTNEVERNLKYGYKEYK